MTLLVLESSVPVVTEEGVALGELLLEMWPELLMYVLGFLVLGVYWLIHHMIFDAIERYDTTLAWLNITFLVFSVLIPFSTALVVEHGATTATALVYGLNMLAPIVLAFIGFTVAGRWETVTVWRRGSSH